MGNYYSSSNPTTTSPQTAYPNLKQSDLSHQNNSEMSSHHLNSNDPRPSNVEKNFNPTAVDNSTFHANNRFQQEFRISKEVLLSMNFSKEIRISKEVFYYFFILLNFF